MTEQGASQEVTRILVAWSDGDESPLERVVPLVYQELRRLAKRQVRREHPANNAKAPVDERIHFPAEPATAQTL